MNNQDYQRLKTYTIMATIITIILFSIIIIIGIAKAEEIDLKIIAKIESSNNSLAYNSTSKAKGLYQITPLCLAEYNVWHPASKINSNALFSPVEGRMVAKWYLGVRIPQMLKFYGLKNTVINQLWAYNAGIEKIKKNILPKETKQYIIKYEREVRKNGNKAD